MATIVTPGTVVGSADKKSPGQGTVEENGNLIALLTGVVSEIDGVVSVHTYNEMLRVQVGDTVIGEVVKLNENCLLYTSPSPRDGLLSRMPSSA